MRYLTTVMLLTAIACGTEQEPEKERVYITRVSPSPVPGEPGPAGERGPAGEPGVAGERGPVGEPGAAGLPGIDGQDGINGVDGADGQDGIDGIDGADGQDGTNGADGNDGATGPAGPAGPAGSDGDDGTTWSFTYQSNSVCTQVAGTTKWVRSSTVYSSNACSTAVRIGTIAEGSWFWLTTNIVIVRIDGVLYRGQSN